MSILEKMSEASRSYFAGLVRGSSRSPEITAEFLEQVQVERSVIRHEEGGGGMCHVVTEWLEVEFGFVQVGVSYLDGSGDVICAGHFVSLLPDGTIFDPTADQMGEGHDMRFVPPSDPDYGRYRPEFDSDFHPGHPDVGGALDAWLDLPHSSEDHDVMDKLRKERGHGWWLDDPSRLRAFYVEQLTLGQRFTGLHELDDHYSELVQQWIDDIDARGSLFARP